MRVLGHLHLIWSTVPSELIMFSFVLQGALAVVMRQFQAEALHLTQQTNPWVHHPVAPLRALTPCWAGAWAASAIFFRTVIFALETAQSPDFERPNTLSEPTISEPFPNHFQTVSEPFPNQI